MFISHFRKFLFQTKKILVTNAIVLKFTEKSEQDTQLLSNLEFQDRM